MKFLGGRSIRAGRENITTKQYHSDLSALDDIKDPVAITHNLINTRPVVDDHPYTQLRLSEIDTVCVRQWVLGYKLKKKRHSKVFFANNCAMGIGSAMHWWLQNNPDFFGKDKVLGYWRCLACGSRRRFGVKPTERCEFCGANSAATEYDEYMFRLNRPYRVVGKADLILKVAPKVYRFGEIKTIGKDIDRPIGSHVAQLSGYMFFSQFDKKDPLPIKIDRSVGYLFYFNKMFNYKAPVKTFTVSPTKISIAPLKAKAEQAAKGVDAGIIPDILPECKTGMWVNTRAKNCPQVHECSEFHEDGRVTIP